MQHSTCLVQHKGQSQPVDLRKVTQGKLGFVMNKFPAEELRSAHEYLGWDFMKHRELGRRRLEVNLWSRMSMMMEDYFVLKVDEVIIKQKSPQELIGELQQRLRHQHKDFLLVGREALEAKQGQIWRLTFGAGLIYENETGKNFGTALQNVKVKWWERFKMEVNDKGAKKVVREWFEAELRGGMEWLDLLKREREKDDENYKIPVPANIIPALALESFTDVSEGQFYMWLRIKKRILRKNDHKKVEDHKKRKKRLVELVMEVAPTCLLQNGYGVGNVWLMKEQDWDEHGEEIMSRARKALQIWPFLGFDSEGCGIWYQFGWWGKLGWEVLVVGPYWMPLELMKLLESSSSWPIGKEIHDDLKLVLDSQTGWQAVDLGIITRDLEYHLHEQNGMGMMVLKATGVNIENVKDTRNKKTPLDQKLLFGYIRSGNWANVELDPNQVLYMTFDVAAAGTIMFDVLVEIIRVTGVGVLDKEVESLVEFLKPMLNAVKDRVWDKSKQNKDRFGINIEDRNILESLAAKELSLAIDGFDGDSESTKAKRKRSEETKRKISEEAERKRNESVEARRKRMAGEIGTVGLAAWNRSLMEINKPSTPEWCKLPRLRRKRGGHDGVASHLDKVKKC